ncbi:hypothetical protein [Sphingobium sp. CAP-1]|uniref:hypothetical protein n=1 Tax=Sphingobium sp. CAP-1 TaxID=2676077 RepID=UPI0012BB29C4|nr:hypothetical protein [Sphingobium sp. CAP-1]QGP81264.1 hypothetical protein GL174_19730 [Sphingobium sp. CAP-1]
MSVEALATLAVHYWKLCAALERELILADPARREAGAAQLRFARRKLDNVLEGEGLRLATFDGEAWTAEIPASPVNADDMAGDAAATVADTIEPTIIGAQGVIHSGKILLRQD